MAKFQPMLGCPVDFSRLVFPVFGSPKLDGWRCLVNDAYPHPLTRTLLPIPNRFVKACFATSQFSIHGLDGEITVGPPNAPDVWNRTQSGLSSSSGEPPFTYWVFDNWEATGGFADRMALAHEQVASYNLPWLKALPQTLLRSLPELLAFEEECLALGFEGIVVRNPGSSYKFGRSVMSFLNRRNKSIEQGLVKVKRVGDFEILITGFQQRRVNMNPPETDGRGYVKRGHAQDLMIPVNDLGAVEGIAVNGPFLGKAIIASPGKLTEEQRKNIWKHRDDFLRTYGTVTYTIPGSGDLPRSARFKGIRAEEDFNAPKL